MHPIPRDLRKIEESEDNEKQGSDCLYHIIGKGGKPINPNTLLGTLGQKHNGIEDYKTRPINDEDYNIKLAICITLYNEDVIEFKATMRGILRALHEFYNCMEEPLLMEEIAIFFIADGLEGMNQQLLNFLWVKDWINLDMIMKEQSKNKWYIQNTEDEEHPYEFSKNLYFEDNEKAKLPRQNVVHLFQKRTDERFGLDTLRNVEGAESEDYLPFTYNIFFAIKHLNGQKLDSHLWFFRGFCGYLHPKYVILLDLGTECMEKSLTKLYMTLDRLPQCGGVCGEIEVDLKAMKTNTEEGRMLRENHINSKCPYCVIWIFQYFLVLLQFVEYKISHFLDKACESFFGFVSVLPGAFSGYRWASIQGKPLKNYFLGLNKADLNCFKANMYLAEDRIMCLSMITNPERSDLLYYVSGAVARTDPPTKLIVLKKQRRRWINGATFSTFFVILNFCSIWKTKHNSCRKLLITIFFLFTLLQTILSFMLVGCFYAIFSIIIRASYAETNPTIVIVLENIMLVTIFLVFTWSLCIDANDQSTDDCFWITSFILGVLFFFSFYCFGLYLYNEGLPSIQYLIFFSILFLPIPIIILNCCNINHICQFLIGIPIYFFFTPFTFIILVIYSFANIHDVTWGNRPNISKHSKYQFLNADVEKIMSYKKFRGGILLLWCLMNTVIAYCITEINKDSGEISTYFLDIFLGYCGLLLFYKSLFALLHRLRHACCAKKYSYTKGSPAQEILNPTLQTIAQINI